MHSDFVFPKSVRLLKRADFLNVQGSSSRHITRHMVFRYLENHQGIFRVGFTVTKKFGNAVKRNRIRRRLREAVRLNMPRLRHFSVDVVVMPRHEIQHVAFSRLLEEVKGFAALLQEIRK